MNRIMNEEEYPGNVLTAVFGECAEGYTYYSDKELLCDVLDEIMKEFVETDCFVFFSFYKDALSQDDIAKGLQCSIETVQYIISRILRQMRLPNLSKKLKGFTSVVKILFENSKAVFNELDLSNLDGQAVAIVADGQAKAFIVSKDAYDKWVGIGEKNSAEMSATDGTDELLKQAVLLAIEHGTISAWMLQKELCIGYAHAGRLLDEMEQRKYISPYLSSNKCRQIYITKEQYDMLFEN